MSQTIAPNVSHRRYAHATNEASARNRKATCLFRRRGRQGFRCRSSRGKGRECAAFSYESRANPSAPLMERKRVLRQVVIDRNDSSRDYRQVEGDDIYDCATRNFPQNAPSGQRPARGKARFCLAKTWRKSSRSTEFSRARVSSYARLSSTAAPARLEPGGN